MAEVFHKQGLWLHASLIGNQMIHIRACLGEGQPSLASYGVLPQAMGERPLYRENAAKAAVLTSDGAALHVAKEDLSLTVYDCMGRTVCQNVPGRACRREPLGRSLHNFQVDGYHHIYGLGERAGKLNRYEGRFMLDMLVCSESAICTNRAS